jgi:hypothetical protein
MQRIAIDYVILRVLERRIGKENRWVESLFYPLTSARYIGNIIDYILRE